MKTVISGGKINTPVGELDKHAIIIEDGKIQNITADTDIGKYDEWIDANGFLIAPGYIDIHIHGALGHNFAEADQPGILEIVNFFFSHGLTSFLPTILSHSAQGIREISDKFLSMPTDSILGMHIEGPYINPKHPGAIPLEEIRQPDADDYSEWIGFESIKLITVAPELPGILRFIRDCKAKGITCAVGHSAASFEQVESAVKAGANQVTHLFNCMAGFHHRNPGIIGYSMLNEDIFVQLICEPEMIYPKVIQLLSRVKPAQKIILISDAEDETGLPDGMHQVNGNEVHIKNGKSYKPDGSFAQSTLLLDQAVRNMIDITDYERNDILHMASAAPAKSLGIYPRKGALQVGSDADMIFLNDRMEVVRTIVAGKTVFQSK